MKKLLMAASIAVFGLASAQSEGLKGVSFVTGQVEYNRTVDNNTNASQDKFAVLPAVGTFISPTVAIGGALGYQTTISEHTVGSSTAKNTDGAFVVMPFARKYWSLGDKLYIFGQIDVPLAFGKVKNELTGVPSTTANYSAYGVNVRPGLDYIVNSSWTFETTIGRFGYNSYKPEGGKSTDDFGFGLNLSSVTFGVKYLFK
ncbi:MAG: outer membrane beta-barrel protein [Bacteroidetes bacterium]|nr:outer membrane beta-barrel protein [Bacteroidota bacterium]